MSSKFAFSLLFDILKDVANYSQFSKLKKLDSDDKRRYMFIGVFKIKFYIISFSTIVKLHAFLF